MLLGYARVSKSDDTQDTAAQVSALKSAGCKRVFEDKASGGRWDRPELHRLLDQLRAGDTLVVWKLDRLSRSLKDLYISWREWELRAPDQRRVGQSLSGHQRARALLRRFLGRSPTLRLIPLSCLVLHWASRAGFAEGLAPPRVAEPHGRCRTQPGEPLAWLGRRSRRAP